MKTIILILSFVLFSVNSLAASKKTCAYKINIEKSVVQGTGFKYTEKTGVTATFAGIKLNSNKETSIKKNVLKDLAVTVDLMAFDSGNALRDKNLRETLFANIIGDSVAIVTVKKITDKKIETEFKLNDKVQRIFFDYTIKGNLISAKGSFDMMSFMMGDQIAALKKRCASLHTGSDGKSVTWSQFDLSVKALLIEKCS